MEKMRIVDDILGVPFHGAPRTIATTRCRPGRRMRPFTSCSGRRSSSNWNGAISRLPRSSLVPFFRGRRRWRNAQTSCSPAAAEPLLDSRNRVVADDVRGPSAVEDGKATGPRESVIVRRDPTKEGEVFEPDLRRSALNPFHPEFRRDSEEDRQIGGQKPSSTRILQEPNRIRNDADQPCALVCVRGVRVPVTEDQIALLEMGANLRDVGRTICEEQERLRDCVRVLFDASTDHVSEPACCGLFRQEEGMTAGPKFLHDEMAYRGLPGTINAFECYEAGQQDRGQRSGRTLNRCCDAPFLWPAQRFYRVRRLRAARGQARGACTISWKLRPDLRRISDGGEREARCRKCHTRIVLLPDDRRQGYCFDCYDSLEVRSIAAF